MTKYEATVLVECASPEEAEVVLNERLLHDEDYGFPYTVGYHSLEEAP